MQFDLSKQLLCMRCMHIDDADEFHQYQSCPKCEEDEMLVEASGLVFAPCHDRSSEGKLTRIGDPVCVQCMVDFDDDFNLLEEAFLFSSRVESYCSDCDEFFPRGAEHDCPQRRDPDDF